MNQISFNEQSLAVEARNTLDTLPPKGIPTIVISNHVFSAKLLPSIYRTSRHRNDVNILCNAGFAPIIEMLGINAIPVKSIEHPGGVSIYHTAWARLIKTSGEIFGSYKTAQRGKKLICEMIDKIGEGELIWLTPAGARESKNSPIPWKRGIGKLLLECTAQQLNPIIVFVSVMENSSSSIKLQRPLSQVMDEILVPNQQLTPITISQKLQAKFSEI